MFILVLLSYALSQATSAAAPPLVVGRYSTMDECKSAAKSTVWINAHGADASKFGFLGVNASATMGPATMMKVPGGR